MRRVGVVALAAIGLVAACTPTLFSAIDPATRLSVELTDRTGQVRRISVVPADGRDPALGGLLHVYNESPTVIRAGWVGGSCPTSAAFMLAAVGGRLRLTLDRNEPCFSDEGAFHVIAIQLSNPTDAGTIETVDSLGRVPAPS